jgi:hypothetical protein
MICNMEIIVDLIYIGIVIWCIFMYVRNTNREVSKLINELEHKKKLYEQETNNSND